MMSWTCGFAATPPPPRSRLALPNAARARPATRSRLPRARGRARHARMSAADAEPAAAAAAAGLDGVSAVELEALVLAALVGKEEGRRMGEADRARVRLLADCLGGCASAVAFEWPERLGVLDGRPWNLVYSSEALPPSVLAPAGAFGAVLRVVGVQQRFDTAARRVENVVLLAADWPGRGRAGADAELVVANSFSVVAPDTVSLVLEGAEVRVRGPAGGRMRALLPPLPVRRLVDALGPLAEGGARRARRGASDEVRTVFIGRTLRVATSPGGELRIFSREVIL